MDDRREFVYAIHIRTTPERLWQALVGDGASFWVGRTVSVEPRPGGKFEVRTSEGEVWDEGEVLVYEPYSALSYTFAPRCGEAESPKPPSRVTFRLEPVAEAVRLTVVHSELHGDDDRYDGIRGGWPAILSGLKSYLETGSDLGIGMENYPREATELPTVEGRKRVFVTYIRSTPERIWEALTSSEATRQYFFGRRVESDWSVGSTFSFWHDEGHGLDVTGEVLESAPPSKLVLTWSVPWVEELKGMPPSRVTYLIEPGDGFTRLSVIEEVPAEIPERFLEGGKKGWPMILSSLKSLLETGTALQAPAG